MTSTVAGPPRSPGRPRSARADEAIIDAVLDLLAEGNTVEALSIEAIAARAGVGKATIYRRWSGKESLLADAIRTLKGPIPEPAGESVRDDLVTLLSVVARKGDERALKIMPCIMPEVNRSPEQYRIWQEIIAPRREKVREVLRRGIRTGELRPDLDVELTLALLAGPLVMQRMMRWHPELDDAALPAQVVDAILAGIAAPRADRSMVASISDSQEADVTAMLQAPIDIDEDWEDDEIPWSDEQIAYFEGPGYKVEVIDGSVRVTPPAGEWHQEMEERAKVAIRLTCPPGWRIRHQRGVLVGHNRFVPDLVALVPGAPAGPEWLPAKYVALAVEVASRWTRSHDRGGKAIAYAEAGIASYWRIESGKEGPVVYVYELPEDANTYQLVALVRPGERYTVQRPYRITIEPSKLAEDLAR